jgi:uncharacterized membrane protein
MEYKIFTGTYKKIKLGKGMLAGSIKVLYCGMPNEKTFSLSPIKAEGYQGYSPNIYYDINASTILLLNKAFGVIEVHPQYIILSDDYQVNNQEYV